MKSGSPPSGSAQACKKLKVGFNKVFGYYIEVSKAQAENVPEDYIRKQTLVNCERYVTPKLKEMESVVLNAESRINSLEYELFTELREYLKTLQRPSRRRQMASPIWTC